MKTLLLVRHAKSSWEQTGVSDHERPLNHRGRRDAPDMGRRLAERGVAPDVLLTSTAVRARSTAALIADALGFDQARITADERLYGASVDEVLAVIRELADDDSCAIVVGHNPETESLAHRFAGEIRDLPTGAVAEFTFDVDAWDELGEVAPTSVRLDTPRS
ncbi:SixA phosphatase family protein [Agromyces ramosus]|uniref:Phosphohistidine phosphatase n=1 Tax=Agromyces ramosus TaxID=33879 RepID=A0ABU0R6G9_9MICO|nr:histidine phosphatase family protein [Agromyces ramosus]MDQ0893683.1 phosphohistidine phosphatase [Agromyces ramosus]